MTIEMTTFYMEGGLAKLLHPSLGDLTFTAPSAKTAADREYNAAREADRANPHPSGEAWCAWWIERHGDTPMKITSDEGKVACESLFAFRAGWDGATK